MVRLGSNFHVSSFIVVFYDIHGRKGEVLLFCSNPDTTHKTLKYILGIIFVTVEVNMDLADTYVVFGQMSGVRTH
jgi:hypothetical protein